MQVKFLSAQKKREFRFFSLIDEMEMAFSTESNNISENLYNLSGDTM